jgi:hypothetical protein
MTPAAPATTSTQRRAKFLDALADAHASLESLARSSEAEVESVSHAFKNLASQAETILQQAAAIVGCVEKESMHTVVSNLHSLYRSVSEFLGRRLESATTILGTLQEQETLLLRMMRLTQSQEAISRHLRALSVLTNVEVAHLGRTGGNFELLAKELSAFSKDLAKQTLELARDTEHRKQTITDTRKEVSANLAGLREEITGMESDMARTLATIDAGLGRQVSIPEQFRRAAEDTAQQIAGVVAAIQSHDITRQQIEHVQQALQLIAARITAADHSWEQHLPAAYVGLNIQICQLKNLQTTATHWTSQNRRCMAGIERLSASELVEFGPTVLQQEQELSSELANLARLQQKSQEYSGRMQSTLSGLSSLVELVNSHLKRSQSIRDRLQILMFNSLLEAQRLGVRGAVVSAIASLIQEVSAEWNALANQSRLALGQIRRLVERTTTLMEIFSEFSCQKLRDDQAETAAVLMRVRNSAQFVAHEAALMQVATTSMHANVVAVADTGTRLELSFGQLSGVLGRITTLAHELEKQDAHLAGLCDTAEVERWLSALYTTEIERQVMSAALHGTAMPVAQQAFVGNAVELF